jgi:dTDP-glucose 4,6-dehydratase
VDQPLTVTGDGYQTRSICYVDDTVAGILAMAHDDFAGPVNIGNPEELTVLDMAKVIRDLAGSQAPITFVDRPTDDPMVRRPDTTLARERLGWQASISSLDGLRRTVDWFAGEFDVRPTGRVISS